MTTTFLVAAALLTSAPWQTFECRDGANPWTFSAADADIASGGWVTVDFTVAWSDVVKERPFYLWSGVVFSAWAFDSAGKKLHLTACLLTNVKEVSGLSLGRAGHGDQDQINAILINGLQNIISAAINRNAFNITMPFVWIVIDESKQVPCR